MSNGDIILLEEVKIRRALLLAESSLMRARTLVSEGVDVPHNIISRLEKIIASLEERLIKLIDP